MLKDNNMNNIFVCPQCGAISTENTDPKTGDYFILYPSRVVVIIKITCEVCSQIETNFYKPLQEGVFV